MTPTSLRGAIAILTQTYAEENFVAEDERLALVAWAEKMAPHFLFNRRGPFRTSVRVDSLPTIDPLYDVVRRRVMAALRLSDDVPTEQVIGAYLSAISSGGVVHRHCDSTPKGTRHLRCNIFLQLPDEGGRPIIADVPVNVAPGSMLAFHASELVHSSEPFEGHARRILLSFGYTVPADHRLPTRKPG